MSLSLNCQFRARRKWVAIAAALCCAASISTSSCIAAPLAVEPSTADQQHPNHDIKDPHYGDVLFQFFQDHYFGSLTSLMVSQHFERVSHHSEEAEILRGGIMLSYGLLDEAADIFTRLIDMGATPATRDRAWFYLAKIRYQRGYFVEAERAIAQIGNALPPELIEERGLLQANLLMARKDYSDAVKVLNALNLNKSDDLNDRYGLYNLGIALIKSGQIKQGSDILDKFGVLPAPDEEYRALRDKANLALGFAAISDKKPVEARNYFERIRLKSPEANKALLGLGWSAIAQKNPTLALVPWTELTKRNLNDIAVLEAKIAVPYAYAELGAYGQSTELYNQAIADFNTEDHDLNESISAINSGKLVEALISTNPGEEIGWFWTIRKIPSIPAMPHAAHLDYVLAQHEFQEAFKNYRDLRYLSLNLQEWREKLAVFDDMLANRRKAFSERLPKVMEQSNELGLTALRAKIEQEQTNINNGEKAANGIAFADSKQQDLLMRLNRVQSILQAYPDEPEFAAARERVRLAQGSLIWQLNDGYATRVWEAKKDIAVLQEQLKQAQAVQDALLQAQHDEPARFDALEARIKQNAQTLDSMIPRIAALTKQQQSMVQQIATDALKHQQQRLAQYATQARFAVAQLYDRGTENNKSKAEADHATTP
ncbi:tetratricopeptide repeat protein [Sapientia aquatica]|uniref:Tetratricopeptide repeat protein n=1 Tax=Sapientia aquatica TaxID=1549640 RepID=A0A4V3AV06_9BURK|nr:hypothetical protein [Sapientia aquatica]TDK67378.1 hypothetical protein E2I14_06350 [Sapientia aquatica]